MALDALEQDGRVLVNKRELAKRILKCSLPTLDDLIERYRDEFPIESRGSNGVEWRFDAEAVTNFLASKREEEQRATEAKNALFQQFSLPIDDIAPQDGQNMSPQQRQALARARLVERKLAMEAGLLVNSTEMRQVLGGAIARLAKFFDMLPAQLGREHGLPDEVVRSMRNRLDDQRRTFVRELQSVLTEQA